jgi:hypothetical protein
MINIFTTKTNRTSTREFLSKMSRSSTTITKCQSSLSLKRSTTFLVLRTGITVMDLQPAKILSRVLHLLVSPKILSMHRDNISFTSSIKLTYLSRSNLFRSNLLYSSRALVFKLGPNLSNIPRYILSKKNFPLILPLSKHKDLRSYFFSSYWTSILAYIFASQVEYCALQRQIYA